MLRLNENAVIAVASGQPLIRALFISSILTTRMQMTVILRGKTVWDETLYVFTYQVVVNTKYANSVWRMNNKLPGAEFKL